MTAPRSPRSPTRRTFHAAALCTALALALPAARADNGVPARILVGFPPGSSFDAIARMLADKLKDELKRQVLVENKPGAGGRLAVGVLKAAPADGSVVMLGPDALTAMYPLTYSKLGYDPAKDLVPVGTVSEFPFALNSGADPAVKTLAEYVAWAKRNPDKATFGIPARGAPHHFFGLLLGDTIGVRMTDVPYQGGAPLLMALMGGQVSSSIDVFGGTIEQHRAGKIRMLAVSSARRMPQAPDVPTFAELGYPTITGMGFNGLYAPAGTPTHVVDQWNRALNKVLGEAEVRARLESWGFVAGGGAPEALAARGQAGYERWAPIIKASGFRAD